MIEVSNLSHRYGRKVALHDVSFAADYGIVGVLGRNGAGKSTLLRILATLMIPSAGSVCFDSTDSVEQPEPLRRASTYLPQDMAFPTNVAARTYLRYLLSLRGTDVAAADNWLTAVGLGEVAHAKLGSYSGGMRQRVGLAYALACDAQVLLLDEPTQGLDPWERARFHMMLAQLAAARLVLFSTHIVPDIEAIATRVIVLHNGAILYDGPPAALTSDITAEPVWTLRTRQAEHSTHEYTITAMRHLRDGNYEIRGVGSPVPRGATPVVATLEDRYLRMTDPAAQHSVAADLVEV